MLQVVKLTLENLMKSANRLLAYSRYNLYRVVYRKGLMNVEDSEIERMKSLKSSGFSFYRSKFLDDQFLNYVHSSKSSLYNSKVYSNIGIVISPSAEQNRIFLRRMENQMEGSDQTEFLLLRMKCKDKLLIHYEYFMAQLVSSFKEVLKGVFDRGSMNIEDFLQYTHKIIAYRYSDSYLNMIYLTFLEDIAEGLNHLEGFEISDKRNFINFIEEIKEKSIESSFEFIKLSYSLFQSKRGNKNVIDFFIAVFIKLGIYNELEHRKTNIDSLRLIESFNILLDYFDILNGTSPIMRDESNELFFEGKDEYFPFKGFNVVMIVGQIIREHGLEKAW